MHLKVAFDIGGVLSKYPEIFRPILLALQAGGIECYIITDMLSKEDAVRAISTNGFGFIKRANVYCADYEAHGELCKAVLLKELGVSLYIDDHPGYLTENCPVRLLLLPDPNLPYYADEWQTHNQEEKFGRIRPKENNDNS